jgi:plastocyanin
VGDCLEDQRFAANGNAEQRTTGGLLVWRKADNWTAFTDGFRTWLNGPAGLQVRLNTTRFAWEGDAIAMQGNAFLPADKVVSVGTTLYWLNLDPEAHDVIAADLSFESPVLNPGESWSFTFAQPGTFAYFCDLHANMAATVTVTPESAG